MRIGMILKALKWGRGIDVLKVYLFQGLYSYFLSVCLLLL